MSHDNNSNDRPSGSRIAQSASDRPHQPSYAQPCRFFNTNKGCRAGTQCPYQHIQPDHSTRQKHDRPQPIPRTEPSQAEPVPSAITQRSSRPLTRQKPVSLLQQSDPREFQIGQLVKRYSPIRKEVVGGTSLSFTLKPSDPDFPFELNGLHCTLTIPASYPQDGPPTLRVTNAEMARGFQINVEKGFASLVAQAPNKTLLALLNDLDKELEHFLTAERAQTIKIVANAGDRSASPAVVQPASRAPSPPPPPILNAPAEPSWSVEQLAVARSKRQVEVRQLEARMGRLQGFSKSSDGKRFNLPVNIANPSKLPVSLQPLKEVTLMVPKLYNLEPCTVHMNGVYGSEVETVQLSFEKRAREHSSTTLMAHINYLIQNLPSMAKEVREGRVPSLSPSPQQSEVLDVEVTSKESRSEQEVERILDSDHPHVKVIPRPPEWDHHASDSEYGSDSYDSEDYTGSDEDYDEEDDIAKGGAILPSGAEGAVSSLTSVEKGISLSFPGLELHGIELLTIISLSLSLKCLRCKTQLDVPNIKPNSGTPLTTSTRSESCAKCATPFTITFNSQLLHQNSIRAGTIEVTGCTIADMLPSTFQPTCSACSTAFPNPPGMTGVRGDTPIQVCRSCHLKMSFTIPEVKFLRLSAAANRHHADDLPLRRPRRENLGVTTGTPLASNGSCTHYAHSYRWFRFSCCGRVHPCDRCHDAAEAHVNDRADRMLCGWCSREQRFRPEDCAFCGRTVVRRRRSAGRAGFWEGGKGTRERGLMSRKEKRKYKNKRSEGAAATGSGKKG